MSEYAGWSVPRILGDECSPRVLGVLTGAREELCAAGYCDGTEPSSDCM